jgi:hypothetical protein
MTTLTKNDLQARIEELEDQLADTEERFFYLGQENERFQNILAQTQRLLIEGLEDLQRRLR